MLYSVFDWAGNLHNLCVCVCDDYDGDDAYNQKDDDFNDYDGDIIVDDDVEDVDDYVDDELCVWRGCGNR